MANRRVPYSRIYGRDERRAEEPPSKSSDNPPNFVPARDIRKGVPELTGDELRTKDFGVGFNQVARGSDVAALRASLLAQHAQVRRTSNFPTANNANAEVSWNAVDRDTADFFDGTSRFIIPSGLDGYYYVMGMISYAAGSGRRSISIEHNGVRTASPFGVANSSGAWRGTVSTALLLAAGDDLHLTAFQDSGGDLNVTGTTANPSFFQLTRIGS